MTRKKRRLYVTLSALATLGLAVGLVLYALNDNIVFFFTPAELEARPVAVGDPIRLGGLVADGSVRTDADGLTIHFDVTDGTATVPVTFRGMLPDLFREGQGVVTEGVMGAGGELMATAVLAKHDENYMPKDIADSLKKQGLWQQGGGT